MQAFLHVGYLLVFAYASWCTSIESDTSHTAVVNAICKFLLHERLSKLPPGISNYQTCNRVYSIAAQQLCVFCSFDGSVNILQLCNTTLKYSNQMSSTYSSWRLDMQSQLWVSLQKFLISTCITFLNRCKNFCSFSQVYADVAFRCMECFNRSWSLLCLLHTETIFGSNRYINQMRFWWELWISFCLFYMWNKWSFGCPR